MGVVNDGDEHFAGAMDAEGLLDEQALTSHKTKNGVERRNLAGPAGMIWG
jgi:hypothetical protein